MSDQKTQLKFVDAIALIALSFCLVIVTSIRFDRNDYKLVENFTGKADTQAYAMSDASYYVRTVEYFRGHLNRNRLVLPFAYRLTGPFLAAKLPIPNPLTALNVLNVFALIVGLVSLYLLLRTIGYAPIPATVGGLFFAISFPVFYYGAIGLSDPIAISLIAVFMFLLYSKRWWGLYPVLAIAALTRETTIVLLPVAIAYFAVEQTKTKWLHIICLPIAFVIPMISVRYYFSDLGSIVWQPSLASLLSNLRGRALLANALTFGISGLLMIAWLLKPSFRQTASSKRVSIPFFTGIVLGFLVAGYAFLSAYADGRFLWVLSIFTVPFALDVVRKVVDRRESPPVSSLYDGFTGNGR